MPKPHTNKLAAEFIIEVLKTCPDQMVHYLPCFKSSCTPRFSALWINAISIMKKVKKLLLKVFIVIVHCMILP